MSNSLWMCLQKAQLVSGEPATLVESGPLFLRLLSNVGAWIAVLFSLGLVFSVTKFILELLVAERTPMSDALAYLLPGSVYLAVAIILHWQPQQAPPLRQAGNACYIVSQAALIFALFELIHDYWAGALVAAVNLVMFFVFKTTGARRICSYFLFGSLAWIFWSQYLFFLLPVALLAATMIWLNIFKWVRYSAWLIPLAHTATVMYVLGYLWVLLEFSMSGDVGASFGWIENSALRWFYWANIGCSLVSLALGMYLVRNFEHTAANRRFSAWQILMLVLVVLVSVLNYWIIGLSGMLLLLAVVIRMGDRNLAGLLLVGLLAQLFMYYYSLHLNLLHKSLVLMFSGAALLATYAIVNRFTPQEAAHAQAS